MSAFDRQVSAQRKQDKPGRYSKNTQPNKCECVVRFSKEKRIDRYFEIEYCPVHAAAPDLLMALKECVLKLKGGDLGPIDPYYIETRRKAESIIARAEGES